LRFPRIDITNRAVQKALLVSGGLLAVVFLFFFTSFLPFFYPPREAQVKALRERVAKLTTEVEQAKRTAANLPRLEKEMEALHVKWELATKLLPPEKEVAALLRKVTVAGTQAGIEFLLFEPSTPAPQTFYTEHPVSVKVRGGYHDFGTFLSRLANMTRIVNVTNMDLHGLAENRDAPRRDGRRERGDTVEAAMTVTAYSLGAAEAAAVDAQTPTSRNEVKGNGTVGQRRKESPPPTDE
jgi:type IV pilus assembly protein PilO